MNQKGLRASLAPGVWLAAAVVLVFSSLLAGLFHQGYLPVSILANLGALGWLLVAPEAMSWRQQLGFDLSKSLQPLIW